MNYLCNIFYESGCKRTCWHLSITESEKKETKCQSYPKLQNQFKLSQAPFTASPPIPSLLPRNENLCFVNNRPPRSLNQSQIQWDGKSLVPESAITILTATRIRVEKLLWCGSSIFTQHPPLPVSSPQKIPKAISKRALRSTGQQCLMVLVRSYKLREFGFSVELKF